MVFDWDNKQVLIRFEPRGHVVLVAKGYNVTIGEPW